MPAGQPFATSLSFSGGLPGKAAGRTVPWKPLLAQHIGQGEALDSPPPAESANSGVTYDAPVCSARGADEVLARGIRAPAALVQRPRRHAEPDAADPASGHRAAGRPRRSRAALPDGADPPGGERGAGDRDTRSGARDLQ